MKKNILFIITILCYGISSSQNFNYQAVVRDASNTIVPSQLIGAQITILKGGPTGINVYQETHQVTTNAYGVLTLEIGSGGLTLKTVTVPDWSSNDYWLEVAVDLTGGSNYVVVGTSKLLSVPYANYAFKSADKSFKTFDGVTSNSPGDIAADDFVFGSTQLDDDLDTFDDSFRMFFDKSQAAFRAGRADEDEWNTANVGQYSVAFGSQNVASGFTSAVFGVFNVASAPGSTAIGRGNIVQGSLSTAIGSANVTTGSTSTTIGFGLTSESAFQSSMGRFNTPFTPANVFSPLPTDRLLVIGNGANTDNRSDALVMLHNGNTSLNGSLTIDGDNQGTGTSYTLPAQDGVINQVLTTNGAGEVTWASDTSAFSTTANVTSNTPGDIATDDFVFGSTQLNDDDSIIEDNNRLFFDKDKGAFRAGRALATEWDEGNIGTYSTAFGSKNIASGSVSVAFGNANETSAYGAAAFGHGNTISGVNSMGIGSSNLISGRSSFGVGNQVVVSGNNALASGLYTSADSFGQISLGIFGIANPGDLENWVATDRLFVISNGSSYDNRSEALVMLKNGNTTLNGSLTIDGDNQGTGTSYTLPAQDGTINQVLTTNGAGEVLWANDTGAFSTTANVTSNAPGTVATDDFVFGSTQLDEDGVDNSGDETRMYFDKSKGAFRVGTAIAIDGDAYTWNTPNTGDYSVALGRGSIATNTASVAVGSYNQSNGENSFAAGFNNLASRNSSMALGANNSVSGYYAVGLGRGSQASSYGQQTIGLFSEGISGTYNSYVATDALFVIGNGTSDDTRSNALVMTKNGNTTLNGQLTIDGDNLGAGTSYTLPAQDGATNQILTTNGTGEVTWVDILPEASTEPTYSENWDSYSEITSSSEFEEPGYYKQNRMVHLEGLISKDGDVNVGTNDMMFNLPMGYRPPQTQIFNVATSNGAMTIYIFSNGNVEIRGPFPSGANWISLNNIIFKAL